jgi:3-oxoacyl-[acyl-carrier protein] reductase
MTSVAIVTGASQGIGRATAARLAGDFHALVLIARSTENLEETAHLVRSKGSKTLIIDVDLSKPESAEIIISRTLNKFGRIDALINISGAVPQIDLFEMTDDEWDNGLAVKFHGARRLTLAAWPP